MTRRVEDPIVVKAGQTELFCVSAIFHQSMSIVATPGGSGGTAQVEMSNTKTAGSNPGAARWVDSGEGAFTTRKEIVRFVPCHYLRLSAVGTDAVFEVVL